MRRESESFGEEELILVYMARRLKDALALEKVFDAGELDYAVETAPYLSGLLFPFSRTGAFFYVVPQVETRALDLLRTHGYKPYEKPRR